MSDLATTLLFAEFYHRLLEGDDPSRRLREAQQWLRQVTANELRLKYPWTRPALREAPTRPFEDPTYWAGATYFGA